MNYQYWLGFFYKYIVIAPVIFRCIFSLKEMMIWKDNTVDTLIAVGRYLRITADKTIPDSAELCLVSFYLRS